MKSSENSLSSPKQVARSVITSPIKFALIYCLLDLRAKRRCGVGRFQLLVSTIEHVELIFFFRDQPG